ncbi:MAG: hydantoin utilization protein A [Nitrospirales bacterium]|nr:MAG: hydantoin utilization protein A [Nitrospirales bacterium]
MDHVLLTSLLLGLALGVAHALDPDHLVAVGTLAAESKNLRRSAQLGVIWGVGHTCALGLIGGLVLSVKWTISEQLAAGLEAVVGVMILALGVHLLWRCWQPWTVHVHEHHHDGVTHSHVHLHGHDQNAHRHHILGSQVKALTVGFIHGMAGSAALSLAVMTTMPSLVMGISYIAIFGLGSIGGMLLMSTVIGLPFVCVPGTWHHNMKVSAALLAIGFGGYFTWSVLG